MKLLLVADAETTFSLLAQHLNHRGFDLIHYRSPIKAMDNLDEIVPDVVLFSAEDFPRHWKPFIKLLRETRSKEETAFILLTGESFDNDEAAKADHLQVHALVAENTDDRGELQKLNDIVMRYGAVREDRSDVRYIPSESDNLAFVITHPENYALITGALFDLSPSGAAFVPDDPESTADISAGLEVRHCSLKIKESYYTVSCQVVRNSGRIALKFIDCPEDLASAIVKYIDMRAERELDLLLHDHT